MDNSDPGFSFTGSWDNVQQTAGFASDFVEATGEIQIKRPGISARRSATRIPFKRHLGLLGAEP